MVEKHPRPTRRLIAVGPVTGLTVDSVAVDLAIGEPAELKLLVEEPDDLEKVVVTHDDGVLAIALNTEHPGVTVRRSGLALAVASTSGTGQQGLAVATVEPLTGVIVQATLPELPETSLQGTSPFVARNLSQTLVSLSLMGSGAAALQGRTDHASLLLNGSGEISADELDADQLAVRLDGSGTVSGRCNTGATAALMGTGHVVIRGSVGQVDYQLMGSGDILHIGEVPVSGRGVSKLGTGAVTFRDSARG